METWQGTLRLQEAENVALARLRAGDWRDAELVYRQILRVHPDHADALTNLAIVLQMTGRPDAAIDCLRKAIGLRPASVEALHNLGTSCLGAGRIDEAIQSLRQAVQLRPDFAEAWINLGCALCQHGRAGEAIDACNNAARINPGMAAAHNNLAEALRAAGRTKDAIAAYHRSLQIAPNSAAVRFNLGTALLSMGDFDNGWREYEWRRRDPYASLRRPNYPQPKWNGELLAGKRILLYAEQALGDAIQFARYVRFVAERGGRVLLMCQPELLDLLRGSMPEVELTVALTDQPPEFDCHCPLESLPGLHHGLFGDIPEEIPYLHADARRLAEWEERLKPLKGRKVGLFWRGGPKPPGRSIELPALERLMRVPGVSWVSLQVGEPAVAARAAMQQMGIMDVSDGLHSFADTAAALHHLDLLISIDSAVVHLAGAMGKPAWVMLQYAADWRWLHDRIDSPWYPTLRLYRQREPGNWDDVLDRVRTTMEAH